MTIRDNNRALVSRSQHLPLDLRRAKIAADGQSLREIRRISGNGIGIDIGTGYWLPASLPKTFRQATRAAKQIDELQRRGTARHFGEGSLLGARKRTEIALDGPDNQIVDRDVPLLGLPAKLIVSALRDPHRRSNPVFFVDLGTSHPRTISRGRR
jgi:hypothetical protein